MEGLNTTPENRFEEIIALKSLALREIKGIDRFPVKLYCSAFDILQL
jgi:phage terminase small subunit